MEGIEILAIEEVAVAWGFNWGVFVFMFVITGTLLAMLGWLLGEELFNSTLATAICITVAIVLAMLLGCAAAEDDQGIPTKYETHYKVTISDEVPMNEFLERYEIIDQDGKIYTVRERDGEQK
jgi:hypothetical protein